MDFLRDFFMLRWRLASWAIPLLWTLYVLQKVYSIIWYLHILSWKESYPPLSPLWQKIVIFVQNNLWAMYNYYFALTVMDIAIIGVFMFTAQHLLFDKES